MYIDGLHHDSWNQLMDTKVWQQILDSSQNSKSFGCLKQSDFESFYDFAHFQRVEQRKSIQSGFHMILLALWFQESCTCPWEYILKTSERARVCVQKFEPPCHAMYVIFVPPNATRPRGLTFESCGVYFLIWDKTIVKHCDRLTDLDLFSEKLGSGTLCP